MLRAFEYLCPNAHRIFIFRFVIVLDLLVLGTVMAKAQTPEFSIKSPPQVVQAGAPQVKPAKIPKGNFTHYNTEDGLTLSSVTCSFLDSRGNVWFGTPGGGVSMFDGKYFTNYTTAQGLSYNSITAITEDKAGNMWFATDGGGVSRYDGRVFTKYSVENGLPSNSVASLAVDHEGRIWMSCIGFGVTRFDGAVFTTITEEDGLLSDLAAPILIDNDGKVWIAVGRKGVQVYDGKTFVNYTSEHGLANDIVWSMAKDSKGNIWLGTNGGLSKFDGKGFTSFTKKDGLISTSVRNVTTDSKGNVWMGMYTGVMKFDGETFQAWESPQGLIHDIVLTISEDKGGNMWFGTYGGGISRYAGNAIATFSTDHGLTYNTVFAIFQDSKGNLWFGTEDGGVSCFDGEKFYNYDETTGLVSSSISSITEDKSGNIWFASFQGVSKFNGKTFTNFTKEQGLVSTSVQSITEDKAGNIWFATLEGVSWYDGRSFKSLTKKEGLPDDRILYVMCDSRGNMWFGTDSHGAVMYDGRNFKAFDIKNGLPNNSIWTIHEDQSGNFWFGSHGGGISRFDGRSILVFGTHEGMADGVVYDMEEGADGTIWVGTNQGLNGLRFITPEGKRVGAGLISEDNQILKSGYRHDWEIINVKAGYPVKDVNTNAMRMTKRALPKGSEADIGVLWVGCGDDRVVRFNPNAMVKSNEPPRVFLRGIKIREEKICWYSLKSGDKLTTEDSLLVTQQEIQTFGRTLTRIERDTLRLLFSGVRFDGIRPFVQLPENLVLPYRHNHITLEFGAVETGRNFLVRYQYMLSGQDDNWRSATDRVEVTYGNLWEGDYTFRLRAMSPDGVWSEPILYSFTVLPPWWRNWWMYALYVVMAFTLTLAIVRWRERNLKRERDILERKIKMRTSAVVHQKEEAERQKSLVEEKNQEISRQKEELEAQAEKLQESNMIKNKLFSIIAHDLRSPLIELGSLVSLYNLHAMTEEEIKGFFPKVQKSLEYTNGMLNNVLHWARSQMEGINVKPEPIDMSALTAEKVSLYSPSATNKGIELTSHINGETYGYADREMIDLVMRNLISNAIKFCEKGDKIDIRAKQDGDFLCIEVEDTGAGIPTDTLPKLFGHDLVSTVGTQNEKGTGLGLMLCEDFVTKNKGKIGVNSEVGKGSTFWFTIPNKV
jgi:ligand-binding sensor domain-containing protein/signal transduction histidine kinase